MKQFATDSRDAQLLDQFIFVESLQKLMKTGAMCADLFNSAGDDWNQRMLTEPTADLIQRFRLDLKNFRLFTGAEGMDLKALFKSKASAPMMVHVATLDTVVEAYSLSQAVDRASVHLLLAFGRRWKQDIEAMTKKLEDWIPVQWKPYQEELLSKPEVMEALRANKSAPHLSQMSAMARSVTQLVEKIHQDGCEGKLVEQPTLKACSDTVKYAVETVSIGWCLFQITSPSQISSIINPHQRKDRVAAVTKAMKAKGVTIGKDILERLDFVASPKYQPPQPEEQIQPAGA